MSEDGSGAQLQMLWPERGLRAPPAVRLPPGYALRTYRPGDEPRFFEVMDLAGWPGWDREKLQPWAERILPEGWFMIVHGGSGEVVATHAARIYDLGWTAVEKAGRYFLLGAVIVFPVWFIARLLKMLGRAGRGELMDINSRNREA